MELGDRKQLVTLAVGKWKGETGLLNIQELRGAIPEVPNKRPPADSGTSERCRENMKSKGTEASTDRCQRTHRALKKNEKEPLLSSYSPLVG